MFIRENAHALAIGISEYQNIRQLPRVLDAEEVVKVLGDADLGGYAEKNIRLLMNGQATCEAIRAQFQRLVEVADATSTVFFYFSGHGGQIIEGKNAGQYLLPVDTVFPPDEKLATTAISGAEFAKFLGDLRSRQVVVALDCCHAGGVGNVKDLTAAGAGFRVGFPESYYKQLATGSGRVIFASSRGEELSHVFDGADFGLFTKHLLAGLKGGVPNKDGTVRIFDLFEYLQPRVTGEHPNQHPVFKCEIENNFAISLFKGGQAPGPAVDDESADEYRYDAYVSFADEEADSAWVRDVLVPRLTAAGLRIAVSNDSWEPGVGRVTSIARGVQQSKRTIAVLSPSYAKDVVAILDAELAACLGMDERSYRLLPVRCAPVANQDLPLWISYLVGVDFTKPARIEPAFSKLIGALKGPLPKR